MRRVTIALSAAALLVAAAPAAAAAAPCPAQVGQVEYHVTDKSDKRVADGGQTIGLPAKLATTHRIRMYAEVVGDGSTTPSDESLSLPAGVPFTRDGSGTILFTPATAGPLPVTLTWTETTENPSPPDFVCEASAVGTLNIVAAATPRVTVIARASGGPRPALGISISASRTGFGDARDILVRAKATGVAVPPTGLLRTLFTMPFSDINLLGPTASRRMAKVNFYGTGHPRRASVAIDLGGFTGHGSVIRKLEARRGGPKPLTRTGLKIELVQGDRVIGGVRTGVICGIDVGQTPRIVKGRWFTSRRTCRTVGFRTL